MLENIIVSLTNLDQIDTLQLKAKWKQLEKSAVPNFFLSWQWMHLLLEKRNTPFYLIEAKIEDNVIGLGLFSYKRNVGFFRRSQLWLHRHGDKLKDQPWIEYNDFLLKKENASEIRKYMMRFILKQNVIIWDEIYIGISLKSIVKDFQHVKLIQRSITENKSYIAHFHAIEPNHDAFLRRFSKNTRAQINRGIKLTKLDGELTLKILQDSQKKISAFDEMAHWHIAQWEKTKEGSGFNNPYFINFHHALLERSQTELVILLQNEQPLGYIYSFIEKDTVYFYMSAINKHPNKKVNIGLIFHSMLMFHYSQSKKHYDFLAGNAQYKDSLSDSNINMVFSCIYKPNFNIRIECILRKLKTTLTNWTITRWIGG